MLLTPVALDDGNLVYVEAIGFYGGFSVHESYKHPTCWTITHRGTGRRTWEATTLGDAVRAARWLDESGIIPEDAADALEWALYLDDIAYTRLCGMLQSLAPRPARKGRKT